MSILKKSTFAALLLMLLTTLFSCELNSEDGRWDPMKWTSNRQGDPRKITATAEGGTYQLKCTNYGGPWINNVTSQDTTIFGSSKEQDFHHIQFDWYDVLAKGNTFYITLLPNTTGKERKLSIDVTAGDIFDHVVVIQNK